MAGSGDLAGPPCWCAEYPLLSCVQRVMKNLRESTTPLAGVAGPPRTFAARVRSDRGLGSLVSDNRVGPHGNAKKRVDFLREDEKKPDFQEAVRERVPLNDGPST